MIIEDFIARFVVEAKGAAEAAKALEGVAEHGDDAKEKLEQVGPAAKKAGDDLGKAAEKVSKTGFSFDKLSGGLKALLAGGAFAAVGAAAKKAADLFVGVSGGIETLHAQASAAGLTTQEFQKLSVVAEKNGATTEKLGMAFKGLNARMQTVTKDGSDPFSKALGKIGLRASDLAGKSGQAKLALLSDALKTVSDKSARAGIAARIFGEEAGPGLANLLDQGSEGINAIADAVRTLTDDQIKSAEDFNAIVVDVQAAFSDLTREAVTNFAPMVGDALKSILGWFQETRDAISEWLSGFTDTVREVSDLFGSLITISQSVSSIIGGMIADLLGVTEGFDGLNGALHTVNGYLATFADYATKAALAARSLRGGSESASAAVESVPVEQRQQSSWLTSAVGSISGAAASAVAGVKSQITPKMQRKLDKIGRDAEREIAEQRKREAELATGGGDNKRTGGGGGRRKREPTSKVTFNDLLDAVRSGEGGKIAENVKSIAASTPRAESIQPTVAVTFYNFDVTQNIRSAVDADSLPGKLATEVRRAFDLGTARAAKTLAGAVVR